jgi:hypothetical protein
MFYNCQRSIRTLGSCPLMFGPTRGDDVEFLWTSGR